MIEGLLQQARIQYRFFQENDEYGMKLVSFSILWEFLFFPILHIFLLIRNQVNQHKK